MDHAYIPTIGHALAVAQLTRDPKRVGALIESAHAILAGLDPAARNENGSIQKSRIVSSTDQDVKRNS